MRILLLDHLSPNEANHILAPNVIYRPDVISKGTGALARVLKDTNIDAIVTRENISEATLSSWASSRNNRSFYVKIEDENATDGSRVSFSNKLDMIRVRAREDGQTYQQCAKLLEQAFTRSRLATRCPQIGRPTISKKVVLIGGGLVNLINAHHLNEAGFEVEVIDALSDPRTNADWKLFGCSRGGDDARMFTLSEMDNYNCRTIHAEMNSIFKRNVSELGWNIHHAETLSQMDRSWISDFESIPPWLAETFNEDIFSLNRESGSIWDRWINSDPALFENSLIKKGILRIYSDPAKFQLAVARQDSIGATLSVLNGDDIVNEQPALASAVAGGHIAGGVNVVGFTLNAHKFMRHLIANLEASGVQMQWNRRARQLVMNESGHVTGIRFSDGMMSAANIVISPGAYCDELLRGTRSHGKIGGVVGAWLRLPNTDGKLRNSLKLSRKNHITEDSNITVATDAEGQPILIIGSGYGYTGSDVTNIDQRLLNMMYEGLIDTARNYFPEAYETAVASGELEKGLKYCVRPWTASSLGVFEIIPTSHSGYCIVTGGHNTGGFAQAPVCGRAVVASLRGEEHAMHAHYHPDRCSDFLEYGATGPEALRYG